MAINVVYKMINFFPIEHVSLVEGEKDTDVRRLNFGFGKGGRSESGNRLTFLRNDRLTGFDRAMLWRVDSALSQMKVKMTMDRVKRFLVTIMVVSASPYFSGSYADALIENTRLENYVDLPKMLDYCFINLNFHARKYVIDGDTADFEKASFHAKMTFKQYGLGMTPDRLGISVGLLKSKLTIYCTPENFRELSEIMVQRMVRVYLIPHSRWPNDADCLIFWKKRFGRNSNLKLSEQLRNDFKVNKVWIEDYQLCCAAIEFGRLPEGVRTVSDLNEYARGLGVGKPRTPSPTGMIQQGLRLRRPTRPAPAPPGEKWKKTRPTHDQRESDVTRLGQLKVQTLAERKKSPSRFLRNHLLQQKFVSARSTRLLFGDVPVTIIIVGSGKLPLADFVMEQVAQGDHVILVEPDRKNIDAMFLRYPDLQRYVGKEVEVFVMAWEDFRYRTTYFHNLMLIYHNVAAHLTKGYNHDFRARKLLYSIVEYNTTDMYSHIGQVGTLDEVLNMSDLTFAIRLDVKKQKYIIRFFDLVFEEGGTPIDTAVPLTNVKYSRSVHDPKLKPLDYLYAA
jgi:hypothetical protein